MKKILKPDLMSPALRFTMPVIVENLFTSMIGLVFSSVLGGISVSSLAAAGTGTQMITWISSLFSALTTGAAILVALNTGKQQPAQTARVVEQSILLTPVISVSAAFLVYLISAPAIRLLMPGASDAFRKEGLDYFRMLLLSLPGLLAISTFSGILRSAGDSRAALACTIFSNAVQLLSAVLFVSVLKMGIVGAGLSYVVCRYAGGAALFWALKRHHRHFVIHLENVFAPDKKVISEILRVGFPSVVDGIAVHSGYMLINTLLIGLGESVSSVYNVIATLIGFTGISQAIVSVSVTTIAGQKIGAGMLNEARRSHMRIMLLGMAFSVFLSVMLLFAPEFFAGLFTKDDWIRSESVKVIWLSVLFVIPAVGVNASEPAARVGGMGKRIMLSTTLSVWLVRVPLTLLFCYVMDMDVTGVYLANSIACYIRFGAAMGMIRSRKWGLKTV